MLTTMASIGDIGGPQTTGRSKDRISIGLQAVRRLLPEGMPLPQGMWAKRHRVVVLLLWLHVAWIGIWGISLDLGLSHILLEVLAIAALATAATVVRSSTELASVLATLGLLAASGVLVHFSGGLIEMHFHFFVMVALVTLYQRWLPFLVAIAFVLLHHGIVGVLDPTSVYNHADAFREPWRWAFIHAAFIAALSLVGLASWKFNELSRRQAEGYYRQLYEGEKGMVARLAEMNQLKEELIGVVSHELRTPITAIVGFSSTIIQRRDSLDEDMMKEMITIIRRQGLRLKTVVDNLLDSSKGLLGVSPAAQSSVNDVVTKVRADLEDFLQPDLMTSVSVEPDTLAAMKDESLSLVLTNLLGNAYKFAPRGTEVLVDAATTAGVVTIAVTNELEEEISEEFLETIFEPFVQVDSSSTRSAGGVGLGLHIVKRIAEAHQGQVRVETTPGRISFKVILPAPARSKDKDLVGASGAGGPRSLPS